jgi:pilus assembly protein CpaE
MSDRRRPPGPPPTPGAFADRPSLNRAGFGDKRSSTFITKLEDLEQQKKRPKQLRTETAIARLADIERERQLAEQGDQITQAPELARVQSKCIVFYGPKGGTGATSMAINVGGLLAQYGRSAVIVDMDLQLGAVPVSLNIKPERSVAELMVEAQQAGDGPIQSGLDRHPSGLCMIAQGDRIEELGTISPERLPRFFDALGQTFEFILVDGLRDFSDHAVATMDLAHTVVICATQDVPSIRAAARSLRIFRRLGYGPDRLRILINRYHRKAPVTLEAIHQALGQPVDAVVRNDFRLMEDALNQGVLVSELKPTGGLSRDIDGLARMLGELPHDAKSGGLFARLFGK